MACLSPQRVVQCQQDQTPWVAAQVLLVLRAALEIHRPCQACLCYQAELIDWPSKTQRLWNVHQIVQKQSNNYKPNKYVEVVGTHACERMGRLLFKFTVSPSATFLLILDTSSSGQRHSHILVEFRKLSPAQKPCSSSEDSNFHLFFFGRYC